MSLLLKEGKEDRSMNVFDSYIEAGSVMPVDDRRCYYTALIEYLYYGKEPEVLEGIALAVWTAVFPSLEISRKRSESGRKAMQKRWHPDDLLYNKADSESEDCNVRKPVSKSKGKSNSKERVSKDTPKKAEPFTKPTLEDVSAYCREKGYSVNAEAFVAHYESNGWKVGKNPMKDWKAAVRYWASNSKPKQQGVSANDYSQYI